LPSGSACESHRRPNIEPDGETVWISVTSIVVVVVRGAAPFPEPLAVVLTVIFLSGKPSILDISAFMSLSMSSMPVLMGSRRSQRPNASSESFGEDQVSSSVVI
jgi:hypothetical protein